MFSRKATSVTMELVEARNYFAAINYGDRVTGTIDPVSEVEEYTFSASAGNNIEIGLLGTAIDNGFFAKATIKYPSGGTLTTINQGDTSHSFQNLLESG